MRILVLGSEGQIGKPLCTYLEAKGHQVRRWDKVRSQKEDLSKAYNLLHLMSEMGKVDKVVFLAFEVGGSKYLATADKEFAYINENVKLMAHTFTTLEYTKKPFLFASSQMANMHHTNYGFLKDLGERYTRSLDGWICRFWNVFGVEECVEEKTHVITDFINASKEGIIKMKTTGEELRQFLHVEDCNIAIESWLNGEWDDNSEYYDITSFAWASIKDVAHIIAELQGKVEIKEGRKTDEIQLGIRNKPSEYIRKFWNPRLDLREGISKVMEKMK